MALSEDLVQRIDKSRHSLQEVNATFSSENYTGFYNQIWSIRAEFEYIVAALKLLNNLPESEIEGKWKTEFSDNLKQIRAIHKAKNVITETLELFDSLENQSHIIDFFKICWKIKEKLTIILNVVKPKHKLEKDTK